MNMSHRNYTVHDNTYENVRKAASTWLVDLVDAALDDLTHDGGPGDAKQNRASQWLSASAGSSPSFYSCTLTGR